MNNLEFLSYNPTPEEKHLGIATIRLEKKYIFRFKIQKNPKGEGYFSNAPAIKIDDSYYPSFQFDSSYESDEIKKFVINHVKIALNQSNNVAQFNFSQPSKVEPIQHEFNLDQPPF